MKYMGSKRSMLKNGLGEILLRESAAHPRFVDLFTGSGAVASFIATRVSVPVFAYDLQDYSRVLAGAIISRDTEADYRIIWKRWRARAKRVHAALVSDLPPEFVIDPVLHIDRARVWCELRGKGPITRAYGAHYFSPIQAAWIDSLRLTVSKDEPECMITLAALIDAASECAASPGHTAQPFQPTKTAVKHLEAAWGRDVLTKVRTSLKRIASERALRIGRAEVGDANKVALELQEGDLVFVDPPYSALHYSRFYHVLESVVRGIEGDVSGVGRYPKSDARPRSAYSVKTEAHGALDSLLRDLASRKVDVILTFPNHNCSNGLSGEAIRAISERYFETSEVSVKSRMSTLGGAGFDSVKDEIRGARRNAEELIILMKSSRFVSGA